MPISRDERLAPLVSVEEAAEILGQSRSSLYRAIERDDVPVPVFTINGRYRIARRSLERLIAGDIHGADAAAAKPATAGIGPLSGGAVHHRPLTHPAPRQCARRLGGPPR